MEEETFTEENEGPSFEDLLYDDTLSDLERIGRYATSSIALQRLVHVKLISETAHEVGFTKTKEVIFPIVEQLVRDEETLLRQHLAEQMTGLSEVCVKHSRQLQAAAAAAAALTAVENGNNGMSQIPSNGSAATAQQSSLHTSVVLDEGRKALFDLVLPIIGQLLSDPIAEVRVSAGVSLVAAAGLMRIEDLGPRVLTLVLQLAHNDEQEDIRMTAAVLLNELAETFGPDLCIQFVASEVVCLAEDPLFRVRKAAALNLDAICRTAGPVNAAKKLLPAFLKLASDDIWGVRKACAESVGAMSRCLDPVVRVSELMPLYERLLNDASKWVRNAALQHLGPFLATLPGPKISASFLAHYVRMGLPLDAPSHGSSSSSSSSSTASLFSSASAATLATLARIGADPADAELAVYCAFSFPAVALTFGKQRWSELRHLFISLSRDVQCKVRRPLAFSIHELARILGPDIAEADLVPAFDIFLKDVNEVKFGVIRNLSQFLKALSANSTRESYLPVLDELLRASQPHNWRFRKSLASQLTSFCSLFSAHATHEIVTPFALSLLADPVSEVREEAINGIPALLNRLGDADAGHQMELISALQRLGLASNYKDRLLFVRICGEIAKGCDVNLFRRHFMTEVLSLAKDTVRNVRRYLAILISPYTTALLRESSTVVTSMPVTIDSILQSKLSTTALLQTDQYHQNETQVDAKNDLILGLSHIQPSSSAAITSSNSAESLPLPPPPPHSLPSPHIRINQSAATQSIDISVSSIDTSIKMLSLETTEKHSLESEARKHLDEEEIFPIWAREDSAGLLKQALITLACDIDAEVVRALDSVWVEKHRSQPLPDVLMYVRNHALPIITSKSEDIITSKSEDMSEIIETVESVSIDERQNVFIKKENDLGMAEEAVEEL